MKPLKWTTTSAFFPVDLPRVEEDAIEDELDTIEDLEARAVCQSSAGFLF